MVVDDNSVLGNKSPELVIFNQRLKELNEMKGVQQTNEYNRLAIDVMMAVICDKQYAKKMAENILLIKYSL